MQSKTKNKIVIIIPKYNEKENIGLLIRELAGKNLTET